MRFLLLGDCPGEDNGVKQSHREALYADAAWIICISALSAIQNDCGEHDLEDVSP